LKRVTDNAKKEYLENISNEIMEVQRKGRYNLMYKKTKELGWKEIQEIQNIGIEDFQGNRTVEQSQLLKVGKITMLNYTIELVDQQPQKLNLKRKKMQTRRAHILCKVKWKSHQGKEE
jgi:hypothetical protein